MGKIYLIGINAPLIPDLAIVLKESGWDEVMGTDENLSAPNKERLEEAGVKYNTQWNAKHVSSDIDLVILASHIQPNNVELLQAEALKLQIITIPEFVYNNIKAKTRLVVSGSKGKRSLLFIIIHVLKRQKIAFDYVISRPLPGIDRIVSFTKDSRIAVIEGDDLISAPIKKKHKLEFYRPHITLLPNVLWEVSEEYPTEEDYLKVFLNFIQTIERDGKLIYNEQDQVLKELADKIREDVTAIPYTNHPYTEENGSFFLDSRFGKYLISTNDSFFLENLNGARNACRQLGISDKDFYTAISEISQIYPLGQNI